MQKLARDHGIGRREVEEVVDGLWVAFAHPDYPDQVRIVGRGRGKGKTPRVVVEVLFDDEQSAWLRAEAERRGLSYTDVAKWLVDEARATDVA
jgi:hypothetical protein